MATTFDPKDFAHHPIIDNPFFPLEPGTTFIYDSPTDATFKDTVKVTNQIKMIDGVRCEAVVDTVVQDGQIVEKTTDYYAQDKAGNVWYFGEDTKEFENGHVVSTEGTWRAGVDGAQPGIIMEANPQVGDSYDQENAFPVAQDHAEVLSLDGSANGLQHLLVTLETNPLEPGASDTKYYQKGVGQVLAHDNVTLEDEQLASVLHRHPMHEHDNVAGEADHLASLLPPQHHSDW